MWITSFSAPTYYFWW